MPAQKSHPQPLQQVLEGSPIAQSSSPPRLRGGVRGGSSSVRFTGYAAIFDQPDLGGDVIRRGAFRRGLGDARAVPLLREHARGRPIGRIEGMVEDARGLRVSGRITDRASAAALAREEIRGLSFGYRVRDVRPLPRGRELIALELVEVSLVSRPMQPLAKVTAVAA